MSDNQACRICGKEMAGWENCAECMKELKRKSRKRLLYCVVLVILALAGSSFLYGYGEKIAWEFSWDSILQRPAAVVNGEPIAWSEARERFRIARLIMEKEYGKELFAGERGKAYLIDLERNVLEKMIVERLVAQEARRLHIRIDDDRVKEEIQEIGREIYGNWENFQASLKEDGISSEYLSGHVRNLLLSQEIKKAQTPAGADPDEYFSVWLTQGRRTARITFNENMGFLQVAARGQGSCCGVGGSAGGGGCGAQQADAGPLDPKLKSEASAAALGAYRKTHPDEKDVAAQVIDYGCHIQVDIQKGGRVVRSYTYQNGSVIDNS